MRTQNSCNGIIKNSVNADRLNKSTPFFQYLCQLQPTDFSFKTRRNRTTDPACELVPQSQASNFFLGYLPNFLAGQEYKGKTAKRQVLLRIVLDHHTGLMSSPVIRKNYNPSNPKSTQTGQIILYPGANGLHKFITKTRETIARVIR